ncbi:MAG: virulence-associated E family protein, partial [Oscillospiraceae bacterium]|nr:virulence-associated E family protein [Oscillospiraceae bacterium]
MLQPEQNRKIILSIGGNRKETNWKPQIVTIEELYDRLKTPVKSPETLGQYMALPKSKQDALKDVGGFVGGSLDGPQRKATNVTGRDLITLDFDTIPPYGTDKIIETLDSLGWSYCVYSTRKHMAQAPRLRIIVPTDRTMTPDEYEPCARRIADYIGIDMADPTTFDVNRLMYWPSVSADSEYVYKAVEGPLAGADALLATYQDWHDLTSWPVVPGATSYQKLAAKQGDPETKPGIVGAFCRTHDIYDVLTNILPGLYAPVDGQEDRYTYLGGSTTGGAIVYDNGKFLFSHHATDPCSGRLVNAFDMVRLHKFGEKDDDVDSDTPVNKLPSYKAMCDFAAEDKAVVGLIAKERYDAAALTFEGFVAADNSEPWMLKSIRESKLETDKSGRIKPTINNVCMILENDTTVKGKFAYNQFACRCEVSGALPWNMDDKRRAWSDTDSNGMYWFMEKNYGITGRGNIDSAVDLCAAQHAFNEVQDYLNSLVWDGTQRLDTLFIDYLGAEDTAYNRAVCRKAFTAAVARAMNPGCKFDAMTILYGPQGIGKSTLLDRMSRGWFNDTIRTFDGKEAAELLQGVWLVEIAELEAFKKNEIESIKSFLTRMVDKYRPSYGRHVKDLPRTCVFFGTTNSREFLRDVTGNRRFWPVDVGVCSHNKVVWRDLTAEVIGQLWAEAKVYYMLGEELILTGEVEKA